LLTLLLVWIRCHIKIPLSKRSQPYSMLHSKTQLSGGPALGAHTGCRPQLSKVLRSQWVSRQHAASSGKAGQPVQQQQRPARCAASTATQTDTPSLARRAAQGAASAALALLALGSGPGGAALAAADAPPFYDQANVVAKELRGGISQSLVDLERWGGRAGLARHATGDHIAHNANTRTHHHHQGRWLESKGLLRLWRRRPQGLLIGVPAPAVGPPRSAHAVGQGRPLLPQHPQYDLCRRRRPLQAAAALPAGGAEQVRFAGRGDPV
jgi:hypothetical protein